MSSRPKPRPKPRPVVSASRPPSSPGGPSLDTSTPASVKPITLADEDELFIKNRSRTSQTWKKLNRLDEESESKLEKSNSDDDSAEERSPRRVQKKRKTNAGRAARQDWTKAEEISISSDDDAENLILKRVENVSPSSVRKQTDPKRVGKRQRSRSRSITPAPELADEQMEAVRAKIRRVLAHEDEREPSPSLEFDDTRDSIALDPELARIAQEVKAQVRRQASAAPEESRGTTPAVDIGGGPEIVAIKVKWKPHPLNENGRAESLGFQMKRHDSFHVVINEVADVVAVLPENIILSCDGKRVFPSASPHGIGIWAEGVLEACEKSTHEYIRSQRHRSPSIVVERGPPAAGGRPLTPTQEEDTDESSDEKSEASGDTFKLVLRSKIGKDITLTVRPTTKCGAIIKGFLRVAGLTDQYPNTTPAKPARGRKGKNAATINYPQLMVDGEKMNPESEIGDADLEDGDMVEVFGL